MTRLYPFFRATLWLILGIVFGLASILLILASSKIFEGGLNPKEISQLIDPEFIVFLCVALIAGSGADYILSVNFNKSKRLNVLYLIIIITGTAWFIFNPKVKATDLFLYWSSIGFSIIATIFCLCVKTVLFSKEESAHRKLKNWQ
jgi:hypothetical protein